MADWKPAEKRKVSSGTLTPRYAVQKENFDPALPKSPPAVLKGDGGGGQGRNSNQAPATGVAKPVPRPPMQQAPCTAEIKTIGAFPPLMRAVSWDAVGSLNSRNGASGFPPTPEETFSDKASDNVFKPSGYKDLPSQPGSLHKLSKLKDVRQIVCFWPFVFSVAIGQQKCNQSKLKTLDLCSALHFGGCDFMCRKCCRNKH